MSSLARLTEPLLFDALGMRPVPQGSKRAWKDGAGNVRMREAAGDRLVLWRNKVSTEASLAMHGGEAPDSAHRHLPNAGPVTVTLVFTQHRPSSHYRSGRNSRLLKDSAPWYPASAPDIDKLTRAVLDSMTGIVFVDDGQVVDLRVSKRFADKWTGEQEGVAVRVTFLA